MPYMTWNVWTRSEGCRNRMDKTFFGGASFTSIFYDAMRLVFYDENNKPGLLYRGLVYAASQKVVIANGRRNGFGDKDQRTFLQSGVFKYNSSSWFGDDRLEIQGPEQEQLNKAGNMAMAPRDGEYVYLHFYNLIAMARAGTGPFDGLGKVSEDAEGRRLLAAATGAVVLHEVMHNHGFTHPEEVDWTPGSDYACTLPHVAFRSVLDAARSEAVGSTASALTKIHPPTCGTSDGTKGKGAPPSPPPPPPPVAHLYNAIFEKGDGRYMLRGWAQADLAKEAVAKAAQKYRLSDLVRYEDAPGQVHYDAVFSPEDGQHQVMWGRDLAGLQQFGGQLRPKGLVMLQQLSWATPQGRRYDALFAPRVGDSKVLWGWTRADLVAEQRRLEPLNYYLHHQHSYDIGGGERRYDAIFLQMTPAETKLKNDGRSIVFHGLTRDVLDQRIGAAAIFTASSPHHIQSYPSPGGGPTLFDVIFRPGPGEWRIGRTAQQLAADEGELWGKGFRTRQVDRL